MPGKNKKGVSPVIATVLLVVMVVITALIIFLWFRNINKEQITKFEGRNVELVCGDVKFDASYSAGELYVMNTGNVPLYSMKIRIFEGGSYETKDIRDVSDSNWPEKGLNPGLTFSSADLTGFVGDAERIVLIPVLVGISADTEDKKIHICDDNYGQEVAIE